MSTRKREKRGGQKRRERRVEPKRKWKVSECARFSMVLRGFDLFSHSDVPPVLTKLMRRRANTQAQDSTKTENPDLSILRKDRVVVITDKQTKTHTQSRTQSLFLNLLSFPFFIMCCV